MAVVLLALLGVGPAADAAGGPTDGSALDGVAAEDVVDLLYADLLGRSPDDGGRAYWAGRLRQGLTPPEMAEALISSPEVGGAYEPLIALYQTYFERPPDTDGLRYWVDVVRSGTSLETVADLFAGSEEFAITYGDLDDRAFVDLVYGNVLGRLPDDSGRDYWAGQLGSGVRRGELMLAFALSPEYTDRTRYAVRRSLVTVTMLRRVPTAAELAAWTERGGTDPYPRIVSDVVGSEEYHDRLAALMTGVHPLTGERTAAPSGAPALAVKIDNVRRAHPHVGLLDADLVYEEQVEGELTRLVAVFQSHVPSTVGPVRSIRTSDFDLLAPLDEPLLAASGANRIVLDLLEDAPVVNVNALVADGYHRDTSRPAPHNLLATPATLLAQAPTGASAPEAVLTHGAPNPGAPIAGATVYFGSVTVDWAWDPSAARWRRTQDGIPHVDATGSPVSAVNIVLQATDYTPSVADPTSPHAHTVGSGAARFLLDGEIVEGSWERASATEPIRYLDAGGAEIRFRPGQTWVELVPTARWTSQITR